MVQIIKRKLALVFMLLSLVGLSLAAQEQTVKIAVLHTNDVHGHVLPYNYGGADGVAGLPAVASLVKQVRTEYKNTLYLDAGDYNTGRPESDFFQGIPMIDAYNLIGVDAISLGNHEFDVPYPAFLQQLRAAKFPLISANIKNTDGSYFTGKAYITKMYDGLKVGIFGLTTTETTTIGNPVNIKGLQFLDEVATAKEMVKILREKEKCDVVILVGHLGLFDDNGAGSRRVAAQVAGIDLIVDGHSHTYIEKPVYEKNPDGKQTPIVQASYWGLVMGKGVLTVTNKKVSDFTWEAIKINAKKSSKDASGKTVINDDGPQFPLDAAVLAQITPYAQKVDAELLKKIGVATSATFSNKLSRMQETEIGDLVADGVKWAVRDQKPDFAIIGGGNIRADFAPGDLTSKDIYTSLPFENSVIVLTLKGSEVQTLFDFVATIPQGKGGFAQVSNGVSYTLNYNTGKCENILINGKAIDPKAEYKIVTNDYMMNGGDGYIVFKKAIKKYDSSILFRSAVVDYLRSLGSTVSPKLYGRITVIGEKKA